jgi:hypothetical protein
MQTRKTSLVEAIVNTVVGSCVAYLIVLSVIILDPNPASAAAWSVGLNVPASAARSYLVRRFFDGVEK